MTREVLGLIIIAAICIFSICTGVSEYKSGNVSDAAVPLTAIGVIMIPVWIIMLLHTVMTFCGG